MTDFELGLKLCELYDDADKSDGVPDGLSDAEAAFYDFVVANFQQIVNSLGRVK